MTIKKWTVFVIVLLASWRGTAQTHMGIEASEFQARRQSVMNAASDGLLFLHSLSAPKEWRDSGFQQDSNFYYLTGLENLHDAILALDGTTKETWLFVKLPTAREQRRFTALTGWDSVYLTPDHQTELLLGIDHIVAWEGFSKFVDERRKTNPGIVLYLDHGGEGKMVADVSDPPDLVPIENRFLLWPAAIKAKWPGANIADAALVLLKIRAVKSPAEIVLMKKAATYTDAGFRAATAVVAPGRTVRQIEGAAIDGALGTGADGISMWPEIKSGPMPGLAVYQKAYDYHLMNRTLQSGANLRMDLGFSYEYYKGDVGRTLPVSGHFTPEQREVINLLNGAYQNALHALHDGVTADEVIRAASGYVEVHRQQLHSELAKHAAVEILRPNTWIMYTHGLDMVEIFPPKEFHTGNTVAIGPEFYVDGQGFYEEDVVLITADGYQLINPALPYTAGDIEKMMSRMKREHIARQMANSKQGAKDRSCQVGVASVSSASR